MANLTLPDYLPSIEWVKAICKSIGCEGELVTSENFQEIVDSGRGDWEKEELDEDELVGARIVPVIRPTIKIGHRSYEVMSFWLDTSYQWCCWKVSMCSLGDAKSVWHGIDCRLLMERPY